MTTPHRLNGELPPQDAAAATADSHSPVERVEVQQEVNEEQLTGSMSPETPSELDAFDWKDFESRYQAALVEANEEEKAILKEAESLSKVCTISC